MHTQFITQNTQMQTIARDADGKFAPTLASKQAWEKACKAEQAKQRRLDELEALYGPDDMWLFA